MNTKRLLRLLLGVGVGLLLVAGGIWGLGRLLENAPVNPSFAGHTFSDWQLQLRSPDVVVSNAAFATLRARVVPPLVDTMLHDTHDSASRHSLVELLNTLPGMHVEYLEAWARRARAAYFLGEFGPASRIAVPDLIGVVRGPDNPVKPAALHALGKLQAEPDTVIPLLITCLDQEDLDVAAAWALGQFGPQAKAAVPKLLPLLHAKERDDQAAAWDALGRIDPEAAAQALHPKGDSGQP